MYAGVEGLLDALHPFAVDGGVVADPAGDERHVVRRDVLELLEVAQSPGVAGRDPSSCAARELTWGFL